MADKNRAQGKSKKAMTKKARLKKKKVKSQPIERRLAMLWVRCLRKLKNWKRSKRKS
jgi:hypothetical protein